MNDLEMLGAALLFAAATWLLRRAVRPPHGDKS